MSKEYREGDIYKTGGHIYKLQKYINIMTSFSPVETKTGMRHSEGQNKLYEIWEAKNKNHETLLIKVKQPNPNRILLEDETSNLERSDPVYNENEVNLLLDSYDEWIDNQRDLKLIDPFLLSVRLEHVEFLKFLREKSLEYLTRRSYKSSKAIDFKKKTYGWKLLYYHRTVPSYMGYKLFDRFCRENPDLWEKMKIDITKWKDEYKREKKRSTETGSQGLVEE